MSDTEKSSDNKVSSAQLRKIKKPIIERRRRERINESLNQLKSLVLDALNKDESRFSKMEKADILEMTVKHLKTVHEHHQVATTNISNRYTAGFQECAHEVSRYLACINSLNPEVQNRLMNHLNGVAQKSGSNNGTSVPIQPAGTTVQLHIPNVSSATQAMTLPGFPIATLSAQGTQVVPILSSAGSIATVVSPTAIPVTMPAGVTLVPVEDAKTSSPTSDTKSNVIPLYVNTAIHLSNAPAHNNQITSTFTTPCSPGNAIASPAAKTYAQPCQTLSCSPKAGDEAPLHHVHQNAHTPALYTI